MISSLLLHYPNGQKVEFDKVFRFKILSLNKEYLFYSLNEVNNNMLTLYFGELKEQDGKLVMEGVKNEDIEVFRKFLIALANNQVTATDPSYAVTTSTLENKEVEVTGGQKTSLNLEVVAPFLTGLTEVVKVEEPQPEIIRENPHIEVTPTSEGVEATVEQVSEAIQSTPVVEVKEDVAKENTVSEQAPVQEPTKVADNPEPKEKKPKKKHTGAIIASILVIALLAVGCVFGYLWIKDNNKKADEGGQNKPEETGITLEQLATKFSASELVTTLKTENDSVNVGTTATELIVTIVGDQTYEYRFQLANHILSVTIPENDINGGLISISVYTSLQELLGNKATDVNDMLTGTSKNDLSLTNDGVSSTTLDDGSTYFQMDLRKKLVIRDLSAAVSISELETDKTKLTGNEDLDYQKGNLHYHKTVENGRTVVTVAQKGALTDLAYQSIVNTVTVLFDEEEATKFKEEYTGLSVGDANFTGYTIEVNGKLSTSLVELYEEDTYDWVVVTINKNLIG